MKIKNVVLRDSVIRPVGIEGLDIINRQGDNGENYMTLTGHKEQINTYLQEAPVLSDRLRTLNNLPKYRIINNIKVEIY
jgi:hypothetical protein